MNRPDDAEYRAGLSPLARGTQRPCAPGSGCVRFIPAGAGNTQRECAGFNWTPVYPRWRGEHLQPKLNFGFVIGLSPLARGTLLDIPEHCADLRFIPAGAGNTNQAEYSINPTTVYPRWRGEHSSTPARRVRVSGLSPLARGTRYGSAEKELSERFIPAGAGNTVTQEKKRLAQAVYPRWRGEHTKIYYCFIIAF